MGFSTQTLYFQFIRKSNIECDIQKDVFFPLKENTILHHNENKCQEFNKSNKAALSCCFLKLFK